MINCQRPCQLANRLHAEDGLQRGETETSLVTSRVDRGLTARKQFVSNTVDGAAEKALGTDSQKG